MLKMNKSTIETIIEGVGMTKDAWIMFTIGSFLQIIWGCETCFISINMESLGEHSKLSNLEIGVCICLLYSMMGFGSALVGLMTKNFGRIMTLKITCISYIIFTLFCSSIRPLSFYPILILRCLSNLSVGVFNIVILNLMIEFMPIRNRSLILMINSGFYNLGNLFLIFLNFAFLDKGTFEKPIFVSKNWRLVNLFVSTPGMLALMLIFIYSKESPLFLLSKNQNEEAFKILERMTNRKIEEFERNSVLNSIQNKKNYQLESNYKELFLPEYRSLTIYSLLICSSCYLNMIGISYLIPKSVEYLGSRTYNISYNSQLIVYGVIQLPNGFIGGWMTESNFFGRKYTLWTSTMLCGVFYFISYFFPKYLCVYAGDIMLFNSIAFGCAFIYVTEVFPTKLRDQAQSFIQCFSFLLGSWSPVLIEHYPQQFIMHNYLFLGISCFMSLIFIYFLPIETNQRALDEDI
jgi:hypothetical protein